MGRWEGGKMRKVGRWDYFEGEQRMGRWESGKVGRWECFIIDIIIL